MFPCNFSSGQNLCHIRIKIVQTEKKLSFFYTVQAETLNLTLNFYFNKLQFEIRVVKG